MDSNLGFDIITDNKRTIGRWKENMHANHLLQPLDSKISESVCYFYEPGILSDWNMWDKKKENW